MAPEGTSEEPTARYATLADWLSGAPSDHPWLPFLKSTAPEMAALTLPLDRILAEIVRAAPARLASKRKDFRRDTDGVLNLRAELNVGHTLARSGVEFAFGGPGQPDYECTTTGGPAWVEVTTRARDDLSKLHHEIETSLRGHRVVVTLRLPRLVAITKETRKAVCAQIQEAFDAMTGPDSSVGLPGIDGQAWLTTPSLFGSAHVVLDIGSDLASHGEAVEKAAVDTIALKVEQSTRGGWPDDTVLVMDLSRLGMSWIRPDSVWGGRLEAMPLVWERIPFGAVAVIFSDLTKVGFHGAQVTRPGLSSEQAGRVNEVLGHLGFSG